MKERARRLNAERAVDAVFAAKARKAIPFEFVLEALDPVSPWTRPMFGCVAVYVGEKIVLILRNKESHPEDNGVWLATTREQHAGLRPEFPHMRSIALLGEDVTSWQVLPVTAPDFEESVMRACEMILARDPRIGKIPNSKKKAGRKAQVVRKR